MMNANCWIGHGYSFGWPLGPPGMVIGYLFWLFVIISIGYIMYRLLRPRAEPFLRKENPLDILKKRYANGEINAEEFEKRKTTIGF